MKRYVNYIKNLYISKDYSNFMWHSIACLLTCLLVIFIVITSIVKFIAFFNLHFDTIAMCIAVYCFLFFSAREYLQGKREERLRLDELQAELDEQTLLSELKAEKALAETNYYIVRNFLFSVVNEIGSTLNLAKVNSPSELDSPSKIITKSNVTMYEFLILKTSEVDVDAIKEVLQTRITQKILANELSLSQKNFIYDGKAYPILIIDSVSNRGNYVEVDIAWASNRYCEMLKLRHLALLENNSAITNFKDGDF